MSSDTQRPLMNGKTDRRTKAQSELDKLNKELKESTHLAKFHGDALLGDKISPTGFLPGFFNRLDDCRKIFTLNNAPELGVIVSKLLTGQGLSKKAMAKLLGSMSNDSNARARFIESQVKDKYEKMLHPPLTYLGDAFQYRQADGKFNSALHPHLGQAGAPYAKTVPSKTHQLGALPDPGDIFDRLMARDVKMDGDKHVSKPRTSESGLSSMLIYHATIIIHDIFRTNDSDKNISDTSSYLDLSPLYGFTEEMQRKVRDDKYKLGLLKPDTFAEDRLLRQPPGVCILLVMYNRYHNYVATQLRRINENGRFSVPTKYLGPKLAAAAKNFVVEKNDAYKKALNTYEKAWDEYNANGQTSDTKYEQAMHTLQAIVDKAVTKSTNLEKFYEAYDAAWNKLDDDLFNTARLVTCGMYIQISVHDYLRALMGFHQWDTNFTLDPRLAKEHKNVSRGLGNQVTVEFNLLYRFHCAISAKDEEYTETFMKEMFEKLDDKSWDPKAMSLQEFLGRMGEIRKASEGKPPTEPWDREFGLQSKPEVCFKRNPVTGLFDDQQMVDQLLKAMNDPISNFGPRNVPRSLRSVEIMGILQARKWEIGTLNDFRDFFGMKRHESFESITKNTEVQDALRDLYEHPDKVELYPGVFCESDEHMVADPGPSDLDSALWVAIFSDAITLVRSDRFYTVDWNTNSLTSWGMKEVTPDDDILKSSVFHRLLQRAFPEWFPYDSIRFFHPFYTAETNAQYAQQQGYAADFRMKISPSSTDLLGRPTGYTYDTDASNPRKPLKPIYLTERSKIEALLLDESDDIVHPARLELHNLPPKIAEVLTPGQKKSRFLPKEQNIKVDTQTMTHYFVSLMRDIVKQESVTMNSEKPIYQIDITRDFAIPVVTRYVADFLGFGDSIRSITNPRAAYSENEIYRHITNCQVFLSYNADETKLLKRRKAFQASMKFLFELTQGGTMYEASRWTITRWILGKRMSNPMMELGFKTAQQILKHERDSGRAAAILLLIALDSAYHNVLAFTSVLSKLLDDLYKHAAKKPEDRPKSCGWMEVQESAFEDSEKSLETIKNIILNAQRDSVKLPVIRKALNSRPIKDATGSTLFTVAKGQIIICDIYRAEDKKLTNPSETDYLAYRSSFAQNFAPYRPKHIAVIGLTAMIKVLAQMKNLRRGHDTQGILKKVNLNASHEGYSNYMARMRVQKIAHEVHVALQRAKDKKSKEELEKVYNHNILKPSTDTYLTPEWDEMVPFPTTWKVRFDGFGISNYEDKDFAMLKQTSVLYDVPPFYQPQGPSHTGGSFGEPGNHNCHAESGLLSGCGVPGSGQHVHAE